MEKIFAFVVDYLDVIVLVVSGLVFVVSFVRQHGLKKSLKEVLNMIKYKTNLYASDSSLRNEVGKKFPEEEIIPLYRINPISRELEMSGDYLNVSELIESGRNASLEALCEKYLPDREEDEAPIVDTMADDLDRLRGAQQSIESLVSKYPFLEGISYNDIPQKMEAVLSEFKKVNGGGSDEKEVDEEKE